MRENLHRIVIILLSVFTFVTSSGQTSITSGTVTQSFDAMGTTLNLPINWKMSAAGNGSSSLTWLDVSNVITTTVSANSGTPTAGGRYNWGTTAATDRAIGFMAAAAYNSPNAIMAFYRNTSGATIHSFTVTFSVERYKTDVSTCAVLFYTSSDGITWQAQPLGNVSTATFTPAAVSYSFGTPSTAARSLTFNNANLVNNGSLYFKWIFVNSGNTTSQGLGLDDVRVTVNTPAITARLGDVLTDANGNGTANLNEIITYSDTLKNSGTASALSVVVADTTAPPGSTTVAGSTKTSALALDDSYTASFNTQLTGQNVLANDFGLPSLQVITYGVTASGGLTTPAGATGNTDNGGTIVITAAGAITYTPPNNFTGVDKFKYIAGTGVGLPNNDATVYIAINEASLTFTSAHTDPFCNGGTTGTITVTPAGGSGAYMFSKDNGATFQSSNLFTGLASGTYQLVVKDVVTGLTQNGSKTLNNPATVTFTFTKTDITCNGLTNGTVTFNSATGGTGPYTYSITGAAGTFQSGTAFTSLPANAYSLVVKDANGCLSQTTASTVVNPLVVSVTGTTTIGLTYTAAMTTVTYLKSGGTGTLTFSITGTLPTGVVFTSASGTLTGTPTQTGSFPVSIIATDANGCTGSLAVTLNVAPKLTDNSYAAVGNTQLVANGHSTPATPFSSDATNITTNDASNATITVAAVTNAATTAGGMISIDAAGKFLYTPLNGSTAADSYVYTASSNGISATATINFTISNMIWYVNNTYAGANGAANGSSHRPFTTVTAAATASAINQIIYVHTGTGNTTGNVVLKSGQTLRGAGSALTVGALSIAAGTKPTLNGTVTLANSVFVDGFDMSTGAATAISSNGATAVNVSVGNVSSAAAVNTVILTNTTGSVAIAGGTITGGAGAPFNISGGTVSFTYSGSASQATASQPLVAVTGGHTTGTVLFNTGTLSATNGTGLQFDNADGIYNFNGTANLNGGDAGIDIVNGSGGAFTFGSGTGITNPSGTAVNINGGNGAIMYNGTISKNSAGRAVEVQNRTGATVLFGGNVSGTGSSTGINLSTNTGATINFTGVITLDGAASVFAATGGGSVSATAATSTIGNSIPPTTTTALNISNTTIGSPGVFFQKINSSTSTANGITLINTGNSGGGFTITGTATTAGSGGIIDQSSAGAADGSLTTGIGIYLNSTRNISLKNMNFTGTFGNFGIRGDAVNNFSLLESNMTGNFGTNAGFDENTIRFGTQSSATDGLTGTALFEGNTISNGWEDNVGIFLNNNGVLNLTFRDGTRPAIIGLNSTIFGNDGIFIETQGTSSATTVINGVQFIGASGDNFQSLIGASSTQNVTFTNNTLHNTHPDVVSGGGGITLNGGGQMVTNYNLTYNISGNSFRGAEGTVINLIHLGSTATISGVILNNIIGVDDGGYNDTRALTGSRGGGDGIFVGCDHSSFAGTFRHATRIEGNQIRDIKSGLGGISIRSNGNGTVGSTAITIVEATVKNNIVEEGGSDLLAGLYTMCAGSSNAVNDYARLGLDISNNTFILGTTNPPFTGGNAIWFDLINSTNSRYYLPGYSGSQNGESASPAGTASANISTFLTNAPKSNVMTNGPFTNHPSKVSAITVKGVLGTAFTMPVP